MQRTSVNDFLEVSINTDKFNSFASSVAAALAAHEKQLQQQSKDIIHLKLDLSEKLSTVRSEFEYDKDKFEKKRKEDFDFVNGFITDFNKKYDALAQHSKEKMVELERRFTQEGGRAQIELINRIKEDLTAQLAKQVNNWEEEMTAIDSQVKHLED